MNPLDRLTRCVACDEPIDPFGPAHAVHEPDCTADLDCGDWACRCEQGWAHVTCCPDCKPPVVIPGQVSLLPSSTRGLVKKRSSG